MGNMFINFVRIFIKRSYKLHNTAFISQNYISIRVWYIVLCADYAVYVLESLMEGEGNEDI